MYVFTTWNHRPPSLFTSLSVIRFFHALFTCIDLDSQSYVSREERMSIQFARSIRKLVPPGSGKLLTRRTVTIEDYVTLRYDHLSMRSSLTPAYKFTKLCCKRGELIAAVTRTHNEWYSWSVMIMNTQTAYFPLTRLFTHFHNVLWLYFKCYNLCTCDWIFQTLLLFYQSIRTRI